MRGLIDGLDAGRGASLLIAGEPGIGKTALAVAARDVAADRGAIAASGSCWEAGGAPPFWPWVQVVRSLVRGHDSLAQPALERAGPGIAPIAGSEVGLVPDSGADAEFRVFDALVSFLDELARSRPLVVILDDLQWADTASVRATEFAARHLSLAPVLLVSTRRVGSGPEELGPLATVSTNLTLTGLDLASTAELAVRSGAGLLTGAAAENIHTWTGGNPFFVVEAGRAGADPHDLRATSLGVRQVLDDQVAGLAPQTTAVLAAAAVVGREFFPAVVSSVTGSKPTAVQAALDNAAAAGIIRIDSDGVGSFVHDLVRDAMRSTLGADTERAIHAALVDELARSAPLASARTVAEHAVAALPDFDRNRCIELLVTAADEAHTAHAPAEQAELLRRALDLTDPAAGAELAVELGDALTRAGRLDEARALYSSMVDDARGAAPGMLADAALGLHRIGAPIESGSGEVADLLAEAAHELGGHRADDPRVARLLAARSRTLTHTVGGDREDAETLSAEAVGLARVAGDDRTLGFCLLARHDAIWTLDTAEDRLAIADEMVEIAERTGDVELGLLAGHLRVIALLELGRPIAQSEHRTGVALAHAMRLPRATYQSLTRDATFATCAGDFPRALGLIDDAVELGTQLDEPDRASVALDQRWMVAFLRGRPEDVVEDLARAQLGGDPHIVVLEALLAIQQGDADAVAARVDRIEQLRQMWPRWAASSWLVFSANLARASRDQEEIAEARQAIAPVVDTWAVLGGVVNNMGPLRYWAACLAAAAEDWDAAIVDFRTSEAEARRLGAGVWETFARIGRVEALLRRNGPGDHHEAQKLAGDLEGEALVDELGGVRDRLTEATTAVATTERPADRTTAVFRSDGDVWHLEFAGTAIVVPAAKGLRDIHTLLSNPGQEISAIDLLNAGTADLAAANRRLGADPVLDEQARAEFRARLDQLDEQIDRAAARHADDLAQRLDAERAALLDELRAATGLGGRRRALGDESERARKTVTARIRDTLRRLDDRHPVLTDHLRSSITTGTHCCYRDETLVWQL